MVQKSNITYY